MSGLIKDRKSCFGFSRLACIAGVAALLLVTPGRAQVPPDQAASMLLNSARKAYNEKNYPFAIERFREFLGKFGGHKDALSARYGLGLAILESPAKDYTAALQELQPLANDKNFSEYPYVLYYLGHAQRGLGTNALATALAKPPEANQHRAQASQRFEEASKYFFAAEAAFAAKCKDLKPDSKLLPPEFEWAARARCDLAEMQLRTLKAKEAVATATPFVKDRLWSKSRYRGLGVYYHGFASFLLHDYLTAGKSLNQLTPFADPVYGTHARYLLARIHHLADERAEAGRQYEAVLADYAKQKAAAIEALKHPEQFKNDPDEQSRLAHLVASPAPDHCVRAAFYLGVQKYEEGKFGDAILQFADIVKTHPGASLQDEARLRQGFCHVQLKQFKEAFVLLQPLADKDPRLADQALLWIGKAQVGSADPANVQTYLPTLRTAQDTFRKAAEKAQQQTGADPEAKVRRAEILLELADAQQLAKQHKDAANTYAQVLAERNLPSRDEEVLQRQATATHLAGEYAQSDQLCLRFRQTYPKSTLLPVISFRQAENAYFTALAAKKNPNLPNRVAELTRLYDESIKRYREMIAAYPDFPLINVAHYGLGLVYYDKGDFEKARTALEKVPTADRSGDLVLASYLLADCLIRQAPTQADDALAAGKIQEQLESAIKLLDAYLGSQPNGEQAADALLKLGYCHQRLASMMAKPPEKAAALASARAAYDKLMQQFAKHPLVAQAVFERAKCIAMSGDINGAFNELRRFQQDPLRATAIAPMALLHIATLMRGQAHAHDLAHQIPQAQAKALEAANILALCRQQYEAVLVKDPARSAWAPLLQYHHGLALSEAGKLVEARAVFELVTNQYPNLTDAAEAALHIGRCHKEEGLQKIAAADKLLATPNLKPPDAANANKLRDEGIKSVSLAVTYLEGRIRQLKEKQPTWEVRARMLYEAAWACRTLADAEMDAARDKLRKELHKKLVEEAIKVAPKTLPETIPLPEVTLAQLPLQPAEQKTRDLYLDLLANFADVPFVLDARFELAELYSQRANFEAAAKLLIEALDKEPAPELTDKIHLRIGLCLVEKGDLKQALAEFESLAKNPKSPLSGQGHYRAGECLIRMNDFAKAVNHLVVFRDQQPYHNLPGVSDRALLRLGHAYAQLKQWDASRQAFEVMLGRFGNSPWIHEARYGVGWAWQNQNNYDQAVNVYQQVTAATTTEIAAKAQLQIGLCRLAQKRYPEASKALLVVPFTYDYPELSAAALCEAARCCLEQKQHDEAAKLLHRVLKEHPKSKWAEVAKERLTVKRGS